MEHSRASGISHMTITAALSVVALIGVGVWQIARATQEKNAETSFVASGNSQADASASALASTSPATDPIAAVSNDAIGEVVGAYDGLQQNGEYSTTSADDIAGTIGEGLEAPVSYQTFTAAEITTSPGTSYQSMMSYRANLQTSLKPLLLNTEPEYEIFGMYVETKQASYLDELHAYAQNYRAAASSTALLSVPSDAVTVQLGLLNAMEEFAADLDALADHAQDPIASAVLLENYNQGESDVLNAFQALVTYEQSKTQ